MANFCIFSARYLPCLGGVERYTYNMARQLTAQGHKVTIITTNPSTLESCEIVDGIRIVRLPCVNLLSGRFPVTLYCRMIMKKLHKMKVDFVIVNTRFYIHSLFGVAFAKKKGIPSIIIEHGTNHFTVNNVFFDALGHIYEHLITSIEKKLCKNYYGVSKACNQWLEHFDIKAKGCLYNGIFIEDIEKILCKKNEDCRIKYGLPHNAKFIFFAGRLVKEKGIEKLIKAVEQLEEKNIYLLVAGDGDLYNQLIEEKHANVIFLGKISYESVICLMKDAEVFCFPTDYPEGFPTVVLEAAAAKCFVITTQAGGSQELIINEKYGIIMHENTIEEIRDSLSKALHIDKKPMIERTYQRLGACFTWEQTCKKLMEIYLNAEIKK